MTSEKQISEIKNRILLVSILTLRTHATIDAISKFTGISTSTIQRDLNNDKKIIELINEINSNELDYILGENDKLSKGELAVEKIKEILAENKAKAASNGGKSSVTNNELLRDEAGHFQGVKKR